MAASDFSDYDARELLRLLHKYVENYEPDIPIEVEHLASDLVQSLDETRDEDDEMYQYIARAYHWDRVAKPEVDR